MSLYIYIRMCFHLNLNSSVFSFVISEIKNFATICRIVFWKKLWICCTTLAIQRIVPNTLRSSYRRCSIKKGVLENLIKFTEKHLCLMPANLLKERLWHRCFPVSFVKFSKILFFTKHLRTNASVHWNTSI